MSIKKVSKTVLILLISFAITAGAVCATSAVILIVGLCGSVEKELIETVDSPDGDFKLEAYRINGGATTAYAVKVYKVTEKDKDLIYDAYRESEVSIEWLTNDKVLINSKIIDLSD